MAAARDTASSARRRCETAAATARPVTLMTPMKAWSSRRDWLGDSETKGPKPCRAPQIAIPETRAVAVAASRGRKRKAAQSRGGMARKERGCPAGSTPPNIANPVRTRQAVRSASSSAGPRPHRGRGSAPQRISSGATTTALPMSPSHQVRQMAG